MTRWLVMVTVSAGLVLGACGSSEKKTTTNNTPAFVPAPDAQALPGHWSDGSTTLTLDNNGTYRWEEARVCGAPPCPSQATAGKWSLRNGKLYLYPEGGNDMIVNYSFLDNQTGLSVSSDKENKTWSLHKQ